MSRRTEGGTSGLSTGLDLLLVNPPVSLEERYGDLAASGSKLPPLGVATLAAVARAQGFSVEVLDAEAMGLSVAQAAKHIAETAPRVLGITAVTMTANAAGATVAAAKALRPAMFALMGGVHATALPEATLAAFPQLDAVAIGEADRTLPELLAALAGGREADGLRTVAGLALRGSDGTPARTPAREALLDLDELPLPAWDLLPDLANTYRPPLNAVAALPAGAVVTSRGCSARCTFCDRSVTGTRPRFHSADYALRMVRELVERYGLRDIHFHDDNLLASRTRLLELCALLEEASLPLRWSAEGRVDMVDAEVLAAMKRAGCWQIGFGVESGSQEQLDRLCKGITTQQVSSALAATRAAGIEARGFFMVGAPGETHETLAATRRAIAMLPLDDVIVQQFAPHPGTEISALLGIDFADPANWAEPSRWSHGYVPEGLAEDDLAGVQRAAFRSFYLKPRVVWRYARRVLSSASMARELMRGLAAWVRFVLSAGRPSV